MGAMGAEVSISGVVGDDEAGRWLVGFLNDNNISTDGVFSDAGRLTTLKTRFATKGQQLLRMDQEDSSGIGCDTREKILNFVEGNISKWDAVVLSDYCKGIFENADFVRSLIKVCNDNNVLVTIDSKSRNISAFENADFVKPNNLELENAVDIRITDDDSFERAGERYLELSKAKRIIVTRGAAGISVFEPNKSRRDYVAKEVQVFDVTGAGDTVISTITLGLASKMSIDEYVELANIAAGVVIGRCGTATVSLDELLEKIDEN
jgi:D-beta-D-heptose 7-phosphate kinase/D-beta-D-heptose 1-phosphate adenosyltransferase